MIDGGRDAFAARELTFVDLPGGQVLHDRWKWFVGFGVVLAILGAIALWNVVDATLVTTIFVGWMLLFAGAAQIAGAVMANGPLGARVLQGFLGVVYALVGFNIIADPLGGTITLTIVIALMLIIEGVVGLVSLFTQQPPNRLLLGVVAVVNILLGLWLWTGIPYTGVAIGFFVGLQLLMAGITWIALGWSARSIPTSGSAV